MQSLAEPVGGSQFTILRKALEKGYTVENTEWLDSWEEGCPSICYDLDEEDLCDIEEPCDIYSILPEANKYGCAELNFIKGNEFIGFYHIERDDEYICAEAFELLE